MKYDTTLTVEDIRRLAEEKAALLGSSNNLVGNNR